jgi:hypothetical protein
LALLKDEGVRSYPSWLVELRGKSLAGLELCRYAYEHLKPGEALVLFRDRAEPGDDRATLPAGNQRWNKSDDERQADSLEPRQPLNDCYFVQVAASRFDRTR